MFQRLHLMAPFLFFLAVTTTSCQQKESDSSKIAAAVSESKSSDEAPQVSSEQDIDALVNSYREQERHKDEERARLEVEAKAILDKEYVELDIRAEKLASSVKHWDRLQQQKLAQGNLSLLQYAAALQTVFAKLGSVASSVLSPDFGKVQFAGTVNESDLLPSHGANYTGGDCRIELSFKADSFSNPNGAIGIWIDSHIKTADYSEESGNGRGFASSQSTSIGFAIQASNLQEPLFRAGDAFLPLKNHSSVADSKAWADDGTLSFIVGGKSSETRSYYQTFFLRLNEQQNALEATRFTTFYKENGATTRFSYFDCSDLKIELAE